MFNRFSALYMKKLTFNDQGFFHIKTNQFEWFLHDGNIDDLT